MQQTFDKFLMFRNRLEKVYRHLSKQARRQQISCWRVYDHDLPEFPFIIEIFEGRVSVSEYKRAHGMDEARHEEWLEACRTVMAEVLQVSTEDIYFRLRERKSHREGQYEKLDARKQEFAVQENGLQFLVNLTDYLDTGLFLDHRITRQMVRDISADRSVLNLFCYTGSFSVYAASGGAREVVSVDLSKTYLDWTERNIRLNFPDYAHHTCLHADVKKFLEEERDGKYDIIIMDPPTFSNSKRMDDILDIQRDHASLINHCLRLLRKDGVLFFSTNFTRFVLDEGAIQATSIKDITRATTPFDFEGKLKRPCFRIFK